MVEPLFIRIRGARMHNLKNIDADLPRNRLVVFTGVSGSGKSTLAFDTLYAEGQRRYVESLSTYARQFLGQMDKPEVDTLDGLSPAVSIEQRTTSRNPRSTVGTITEIYDFLRLLYARAGQPYCPQCGRQIRPQSIEEMVNTLLSSAPGEKVMLLAPLVEGKKGEFRELLERLRKDGYSRARIDGAIYGLEESIELDKNRRHSIAAVIDRLALKPSAAKRLSDSIATAVGLAAGSLLANFPERGTEMLMSEKAACIDCGRSLPEISPQLFSFNNPKGACPECGGLGVKQFFDPALVVPDPTISVSDGAIAPWSHRAADSYTGQMFAALAAHYRFDLDTPFGKLPKTAQEVILYGTGRQKIDFEYQRQGRRLTTRDTFEGVIPQLARRFRETASSAIREELAAFMSEQPCPGCRGARLKPEVLAVRVADRSIHELTQLSIFGLMEALPALELPGRQRLIAAPILKEIQDRLCFLADVGLGYLALARQAATLSGGEAQRIRLASQIGSRLAGVLYILDEPSIGLHQRDNERLIRTLAGLRDQGNTVIVVEHDSETILAADHVLDMGPGAGRHGGEVVFSGQVADLLKASKSITGAYLSGRLKIATPAKRRRPRRDGPGRPGWIVMQNARVNNLKGIEARFPLGLLTCVTGVSGSGKSSLVVEALFRGAMEYLRNKGEGQPQPAADAASIAGLKAIDKVIDIDQGPIGRTPRSNPATYTGVLAPIRELLARLPEARARGYRPGRFSFNIKGGRCEACQGDGVIRIAMHFLPDLYVTCEVCNGRRYNRDTLDISYRGRNIAGILDLTISDALEFFTHIPQVRERLQTLFEVGLGYLTLGQSAMTLSGGEAQRIKLARELSRKSTGRTLYILDEPTTGLHPADIAQLLTVLDRLVEKGNTVVVIEHNLDVIKTADHVIDLGPEGGEAGGSIVAVGTPEQIAACSGSHTGAFLRKVLT